MAATVKKNNISCQPIIHRSPNWRRACTVYNAHTVHHVILPSLNKCSQSVLLQEHKPEIAMLCTLHPIDMKLARKDTSNPAPQRRTCT